MATDIDSKAALVSVVIPAYNAGGCLDETSTPTFSTLPRELNKRLTSYRERAESLRYVSSRNSACAHAGNGVLLVTHECSKSGAPALLLHIAETLTSWGIPVAFCARSLGALAQDMAKVGPVFYCPTKTALASVATRLRDAGYSRAIINSVACAPVLPRDNAWPIDKTLFLVHELPGVIRELHLEDDARRALALKCTYVFPSSFVRDRYFKMIGEPQNHLVKPQAVYKAPSPVPALTRGQIAEKYHIPSDRPWVLNVANAEPRKGFDYFLDLAALNPSYEWIWAGKSDPSMLVEALKRNGVASLPNVTLAGYVPFNEISSLFSASDAFALTSREDPFPSAVLEAFAAGTPVVAFDGNGGYTDVVIDGQTGFLAGSGDLAGFSVKLALLLNDKELAHAIAKNGKKYVEANTFEAYVETLLSLLG